MPGHVLEQLKTLIRQRDSQDFTEAMGVEESDFAAKVIQMCIMIGMLLFLSVMSIYSTKHYVASVGCVKKVPSTADA